MFGSLTVPLSQALLLPLGGGAGSGSAHAKSPPPLSQAPEERSNRAFLSGQARPMLPRTRACSDVGRREMARTC
jgi:hypothetical protein